MSDDDVVQEIREWQSRIKWNPVTWVTLVSIGSLTLSGHFKEALVLGLGFFGGLIASYPEKQKSPAGEAGPENGG